MAMLSVLDREHTVAPQTFNRWLIPPAALAVVVSVVVVVWVVVVVMTYLLWSGRDGGWGGCGRRW